MEMSFERSFERPGGSLDRNDLPAEIRRTVRSTQLASGTLACPECDAPVALSAPRMTPTDPLACPYCEHTGTLRDFLSLKAPTRPTRVVVHVRAGGRLAVDRARDER
jgi:hypothetical protein